LFLLVRTSGSGLAISFASLTVCHKGKKEYFKNAN
jgi:hypothetical protein